MKTLMILVTIVLLSFGIASAKDYEVTRKAGDYNVIVRIDRNPPVAGDNNVRVEITDASGHHARDAKVVLEYSMPAMAGMPAMNYKAEGELKGDDYKAKLNFSMSGSWNIVVRITREGKTVNTKFTVDVK